MTSRRIQKAAAAIRQVVSMAILTDIKDPRVQGVTVTHVEVSPDMRQAKVHVSVMGDETQQRLTLHGLRSAAGYLQSKIAAGIDTRYTPRLEFLLDQGVKKSLAVAAILQRVLPPADDAAESDDSTAADDENADGTTDEAEDDASPSTGDAPLPPDIPEHPPQ
jgi:ribosome-binding factor A